MDIVEIKNILKQNKRISFFIPDLFIFNKFESILLKNGYKWRSQEMGTSLLGTREKNDVSRGNICIWINYRGYEPKILSYDSYSHPSYCDIVLINDNINDMMISLFDVKPNYKPKGKVERTI